jgi:glycosyltransferase involved in cell wall biosynthesis
MIAVSGKISVVIPLFNKGPYIARTLDSVLRQTFQDFKVIVVDDGSTDDGAEIVRGFDDPRIQLIQQPNQGESVARNRGVDESQSDFVAFLDADDEWMPKHLETILNLIEKYPSAGMYTTACARKFRTTEEKIRSVNYQCIPNPPWEGLIPDYFKSGARGSSPVNSSVAVIPRKIFQEVGGFPEGYWWGPDADLFGKIALRYPVAFSWEVGAIYHVDASNRASDRHIPPDYQEPFVTTAFTALAKGEVPQELTESLIEYIYGKEYVRAMRYIADGDPAAAKTILKQFKTKWNYKDEIKWSLRIYLPIPIFLFLKNIKRKLFYKVPKNP